MGRKIKPRSASSLIRDQTFTPVRSFQAPPSQLSCPTSPGRGIDRKSTRLNSSHDQISYAVFCLKKKKTCAPISTSQSFTYPLTRAKIDASCQGLTSAGKLIPLCGLVAVAETTATV